MKSQTFEFNLERDTQLHLRELSRAGALFYNAALKQRRESPGILNRVKQIERRSRDELCRLAGINPLPVSVMKQLLLELDVITFTPARYQERSPGRFYPVTWTGSDIEIDNGGILLQPDIRLPFPEFNTPSGILTKVRVKTILNSVTIVGISWKDIPKIVGPGRDVKRAFGYTPVEGAVEGYVKSLVQEWR